MRLAQLVLLGCLAACGHEDPWQATPPDPLGPITTTLPRRLTFNTGDDRAPTLSPDGGRIAFARYDPAASPKPCIAYLPAAGGTLEDLFCPPRPSAADTFESTWSWPVLSPDGQHVAYLWQRAGTASELSPWTSELIIASSARPGAVTTRVNLIRFLPEGFATTMLEPVWLNAGTVRALIAYDSIVKVKGGGAERFTDSMVVARRLMDVDVVTGTLTPVPGADSAIAWTPGSGASFWIVRAPARLLEVAGGVATERAAFSVGVTDLAEVSGRLVAALGDSLIEWIEPVSGARGFVSASGPVRRIAAAGGRRFVAEVERGVVLFGAPANLWLYEVP